jgi:hypothetical protein
VWSTTIFPGPSAWLAAFPALNARFPLIWVSRALAANSAQPVSLAADRARSLVSLLLAALRSAAKAELSTKKKGDLKGGRFLSIRVCARRFAENIR